MQAVDTNVLVRLLVGDDPQQSRAAERWVVARGGAWVSHVVLAETSWVLAKVYQRSRDQIRAAIQSLLEHALFAIQDPDVVSLALEHFRRHRRLGFSDCLILEMARKSGYELGTFDHDLARLGGAARIS